MTISQGSAPSPLSPPSSSAACCDTIALPSTTLDGSSTVVGAAMVEVVADVVGSVPPGTSVVGVAVAVVGVGTAAAVPRAAVRNACCSATRSAYGLTATLGRRLAGAAVVRRREALVEHLPGPAVDVVRVEDDGDQRAAVAGRGRDERVAGAFGEAGLEAGCVRIGAGSARQHAVVVRERARQAGRIDELVLPGRAPLRELGHGERVAGRDRDVERAHAGPAVERRLVVEAGRVGERAVLHAEPGPRSAARPRRIRRGCRRPSPRWRRRRRSPMRAATTRARCSAATADPPAC